ncbi:MAG: peptidylprolyl isomerase [Candidatus Hydrogenedentes bacterium]|nr:peptidylprolyl isomerase [Candidatus Hydrogenedentota bacterium]
MTLEFDEDAPEPRDYTKWVWAGVIVLFVALMGILYLYSGLTPQQSIVNARHILISFSASDPGERGRAQEQLRDIRERILKGDDFGDLAEEYSNDPGSASKGGNLGYMKKGQLTAEIEDYVWSAPIGQLSEIIQTKFGFHLVVVDDRKLSKVDELRMLRDEEWKERMRGGTDTAPASSEVDAQPAQPAQP